MNKKKDQNSGVARETLFQAYVAVCDWWRGATMLDWAVCKQIKKGSQRQKTGQAP